MGLVATMFKPAHRIDEDAMVLLVGSSGGHLAQLLKLRDWWGTRRRLWVTFDTPDAKSALRDEEVIWAHYPTTRNIPNLLRNAGLAIRLMRTRRPDVVVSTGAGAALPFFILGRLCGALTVYIEVYDRVSSATLTGRLCRPFTRLFLVQWPEQLGLYRDARLLGPLL